ncbi:MAG: hypothetical protein ACXWLM_03905 [Myxococcales bacterium]
MRSFVAVVVLSAACVAPIRASSRDVLTDQQATLSLELPREQAVARLGEAMRSRRFEIIDKRAAADGLVLKYKGQRTSVTVVAGYAQKGSGQVQGSSNDIGSVFYAFVSSPAPGRTVIRMVGKPTGNGREVCSDHDQDLDACPEDVKAGVNFVGRQQMTGREEAETIRGVFAELSP